MAPIKIVAAAVLVLATVGWLAYTGVRDTKSYYCTIGELNAMGKKAYTRNLRVAGNVQPGSIQRSGTNARFVLLEQGLTPAGELSGSRAPAGHLQGRRAGPGGWDVWADGVFHATQLQPSARRSTLRRGGRCHRRAIRRCWRRRSEAAAIPSSIETDLRG